MSSKLSETEIVEILDWIENKLDSWITQRIFDIIETIDEIRERIDDIMSHTLLMRLKIIDKKILNALESIQTSINSKIKSLEWERELEESEKLDVVIWEFHIQTERTEWKWKKKKYCIRVNEVKFLVSPSGYKVFQALCQSVNPIELDSNQIRNLRKVRKYLREKGLEKLWDILKEKKAKKEKEKRVKVRKELSLKEDEILDTTIKGISVKTLWVKSLGKKGREFQIRIWDWEISLSKGEYTFFQKLVLAEDWSIEYSYHWQRTYHRCLVEKLLQIQADGIIQHLWVKIKSKARVIKAKVDRRSQRNVPYSIWIYFWGTRVPVTKRPQQPDPLSSNNYNSNATWVRVSLNKKVNIDDSQLIEEIEIMVMNQPWTVFSYSDIHKKVKVTIGKQWLSTNMERVRVCILLIKARENRLWNKDFIFWDWSICYKPSIGDYATNPKIKKQPDTGLKVCDKTKKPVVNSARRSTNAENFQLKPKRHTKADSDQIWTQWDRIMVSPIHQWPQTRRVANIVVDKPSIPHMPEREYSIESEISKILYNNPGVFFTLEELKSRIWYNEADFNTLFLLTKSHLNRTMWERIFEKKWKWWFLLPELSFITNKVTIELHWVYWVDICYYVEEFWAILDNDWNVIFQHPNIESYVTVRRHVLVPKSWKNLRRNINTLRAQLRKRYPAILVSSNGFSYPKEKAV